jgi:hypothetical protein
MRGISRAKKGEMTAGERKFHIDELRDLCSSSDIIRMTDSRRMDWVGLVACMKGKRNAYKVLGGKVERSETAWRTQV